MSCACRYDIHRLYQNLQCSNVCVLQPSISKAFGQVIYLMNHLHTKTINLWFAWMLESSHQWQLRKHISPCSQIVQATQCKVVWWHVNMLIPPPFLTDLDTSLSISLCPMSILIYSYFRLYPYTLTVNSLGPKCCPQLINTTTWVPHATHHVVI